MLIQSRTSGAAVLAIVVVLFVALYFVATTPAIDLLRRQLIGCGITVAVIAIVWLMHRLRTARRARSLMKLVRPAWL
ncbi:hypothetical protein AWV80_22145 [Cupriavidus sp. UYMU48A]|nr:hypothetical protein AWV80_22145 [Cupriavidus sp. UYMU48A]